MKHSIITILVALALIDAAPIALAEKPTSAPATKPADAKQPKLSVTEHTLDLASGPIKYKATTGTLPLTDDAGKVQANMFFVAYERTDLADAKAPRPLTFVFNGGPGAAAVWLHLGTAGPMRVAMDDAGHVGAPPFKLVPNEQTWLDASDLVFIDPVGTGFSRPAEGVSIKDFTGTQNDLASVATFIRLYLTRNNRWLSPIYLAGESYGTTRAAALSLRLAENEGISVSGIALISTVLNFQTLDFKPGNDAGYASFMPTYATVAWFHQRLSEERQKLPVEQVAEQARAWMEERYLTALVKGSRLSDADRRAIAEEYAGWTGLSTDFVLDSNLRVSPDRFEAELLEADRKIIGRFDGRLTAFNQSPADTSPEFDPSYAEYLPAYTTTWNAYVRDVLQYESDIKYQVVSPLVHPWDFGKGFLNVSDDLISNLVRRPHTKILICSGYYDLATPFAAVDSTMASFDLGPALRKQITTTYFTAGHMMYHNASDRARLHEALRKLVTTKEKE